MENDDHVVMEKGYLDHEVDQKKDNQIFQGKLDKLESYKVELEREVKVLRKKNEELELRIQLIEKGGEVRFEDKESVLESSQKPITNDKKMESDEESVQLKIENKVLEFEKQFAEGEVKTWKQKCKELELQLASFREKEEFGNDASAIHDSLVTSPTGHSTVLADEVAQNEGILCVKTPDKSVNFKNDIVVRIINLDGVPAHSSPSRKELFHGDNVVTSFALTEGREDPNDCNEEPFVATPKRKRSLKRSLSVVTSDTESDNDDNKPIALLLKKKHQRCAPQNTVSECDVKTDFLSRRRRRLVKAGQYKTDESENDDDSIGNFIVSSLDNSESESAEEASDDSSANFDDILHKIRRSKDNGSEWELEGDMLAALAKDPLLCMKAVCTLYRQQTGDEQQCHETFVRNRRGFSAFDAQRGSELAEFLTDDDLDNDVTKSVEELNEFDPDGLEVCRKLASRYSKQLFNIYKNGEDPYFFPPSQ